MKVGTVMYTKFNSLKCLSNVIDTIFVSGAIIFFEVILLWAFGANKETVNVEIVSVFFWGVPGMFALARLMFCYLQGYFHDFEKYY